MYPFSPLLPNSNFCILTLLYPTYTSSFKTLTKGQFEPLNIMALLNLPTEILSRIIKETIPESFENLAVTCITAYNASQYFLPKHNKFRRRYRNFAYGSAQELQDGRTCATSLQLIHGIAEEPVIARYIVSADFKNDQLPEEVETCRAQIQQITASPYVLQLLKNSSYLQSAGVDPSTVLHHLISQHKPAGTASLAATFLLTLLPNVTTLALPKNWEESERLLYDAPTVEKPLEVRDLLDEIVERANDPSDSTAGLSKLTSILPSTAWGY
jgi:hypothetical protein